MRRLRSVVRLDRGGGSLGGRGVAVGEVRPQGVGVMGPQGLAADEAWVETICHRQAASTEL